MKNILLLLLSTTAICNAALIQLGISPAGTDAAIGLSPTNEVPAVTNSTGSGGPISGGVVFDTDSTNLNFAIGYGSAAGFSDLSGPAIGLSLSGPAATNEVGGVLFDLGPYLFLAADPARGGVIFGSIAFPANAVSNLLAGLNYVNINTATNPTGEIRGQLVLLNRPPTVSCPDPATVECGTAANVSVTVGDPDGDALTVVWTLNGTAIQTNAVAGGTPPTSATVSFVGILPLGTNTLGVTVTDTATNSASCSTVITVVDTIPPVIQSAGAQPNVLWPPNHRMVTVTVSARVTDQCGPTAWKIIEVTSNESAGMIGSGNTTPDWVVTGDHTVSLRAERSGTGSGRVYSITIQARDVSGNLSDPEVVTVRVPKSQGGGN